MKKLLFAVLLLGSVNVSIAQELTQKMYNIYKGQAKMVIERFQGSDEKLTVKFDRRGRTLSQENGGTKFVYNWSSDGMSVTVEGYQNGQYQGSEMIYIDEFSEQRYSYRIQNVRYEVIFRQNGSINKTVMSGGGQTMTTVYYYNSSSSLFPYKTVVSMDGQSMMTTFTVLDCDEKGNCIKNSQSANGETVVNTTTIIYY